MPRPGRGRGARLTVRMSHRHLRIARRTLGYCVASAVILLALVLGTTHQLLPLAERNPDRVAAWLSARAGRTVAFDRVRTSWTRRGPLLRLDRLRVGDGAQAFVVGDTEMLVSMYAGVLPGHTLTELRIRGLDLTLERAADGRWRVRGLPGQAEGRGDPLSSLEGLGELQVIGARLSVVAPTLGVNARLPRIDLRLRVDGARVRAGARAWAPDGGAPLDAALDIDRTRGDGLVYAGATRADLRGWSPLLAVAGVRATAGEGRAQAWATLEGHRISQVTTDLDLRGMQLVGAPLDGVRPTARFARVQALLRWQRQGEAWHVSTPRLRTEGPNETQVLDGLSIAGGPQFALRAGHVDAGPLVALAALSDRPSPALRRWLQRARPHALLRGVELTRTVGGSMHLRGAIENFGFASVGGAPGLDHVYARLDGDANGVAVDFSPLHKTRFDWPSGFGVAHDVALSGRVAAFREGQGWRVATPSLQVDGSGFAATARGGMTWQGDGSRPWIDLATTIDQATLPVAKGFWIRSHMSKPLIDWLDQALVSGSLVNARAIVSGDLDDWPFNNRNGRFEASAHIARGVVKFQPDWPAAEDLEGDIRFVADGFHVDGTARVADVRLPHIEAGIDHYTGGNLTVQAQTRTDAAALLALLRRSSLQKSQGETLANLSAHGPADVGFQLDLPLRPREPLRLGGTVALAGAHLADARWKLAFDDVRGRAVYSQTGFAAEGLSVRRDGQPGKLSLRAGLGHVKEKGHVFEAALDASVRADDLIARAPDELNWLKPYLDGRSNWTIGVAIGTAVPGNAAPTQLQLRSNLVGTTLTLPAPLAKTAATPLTTTIDTPLPLGSGDVRVALGALAAVRARTTAGKTGIRVVLGSNRVDDAPPASGLVATGHAATLDAIDWIALSRGTGGNGGDGLALQRIDLNATRLVLLGGSFANAHVVVVPAPAGATAVRVDAPTLQGALLVPAAENAAIAGRFARVYWRAGATDSQSTGGKPAPAVAGLAAVRAAPSPARPAAGTTPFDPAAVPPLNFDVDDLRLNEARLGNATFRSHPTATGMRVDQLQTRDGAHRLDLSGDWNGRGATARTQLDGAFSSEDFGTLLSGLGLGGRLAGGKGSMQLRAGWPGSPADFSLASIDGTLTLDARNGRLLEVEPGAGRVLGLLSLAELPRRLSLDFHDFFSKGFAFNRMSGTLKLGDGAARSDNLRIDGPAATIDISGATNLRAQRFDQTIVVHPKSGNLLTAVGAIAGGPVGAALGAAANAVLKKPLGNIGAKTYRVTGPWSEPKVEVVGKEQGRLTTADADPTG